MLLTSGCSFVWGDELEGYDQSPPTHWDKTFTHHLAKKLGLEYVNIAQCGNGNRKIFRDTMKYLRNYSDEITHCVVLWSAWEREEVAESYGPSEEALMKIKRDQCMTQFSPARINMIRNMQFAQALEYLYDHFETKRTQIIEAMTYMTHMQWLCQKLNIKLVQGTFHHRSWEELVDVMKPENYSGDAPDKWWGEWMEHIQDELNYLTDESRVGLNRYTDLVTIAEKLDDVKPAGHAGEESQLVFTETLYEAFQKV